MRVLMALFAAFLLCFGAELKIATYNVENLFDDKIDGTEYRDFKGGHWNSAKYSQKLKNISKVLKDLDADVVGLNEIENERVLSDLAALCGYKYYKFATTRGAPVGLGLLSRHQITSSRAILVPNVKTRPILKTSVDFEGEILEFFVAHFPAAKNPLKDRKVVAATMQEAVSGAQNAIILGDLNSNYGYDFLLKNLKDWTNLWEFVSPRDRSSYVKGKSAIDHIMLQKSFFGDNSIKFVDGSFEVFKPYYLKSGSFSDHYALSAKITTTAKYVPAVSKKIADIKAPSSDRASVAGVVIYKDKYGYILADSSRRGIYIYEKNPAILVGSKVEAVINKTEIYRDNIQASSISYISAKESAEADISSFLLDSSELKSARSGDGLKDIELDIRGGYAEIAGQRYKIYSPKGKVADGKIVAKKAIFWIYKGEKELIIE